MMGGLMCERRNSTTAAPQVASEAPDSTSLKLDESSSAVSGQNKESGFEDYLYEYSNQCVAFADNRFEYVDSASGCIGHGSYGTVFKGYDRVTQRDVAIKKMATLNVKPDELKAMQRLHSNFLVALIDICDENKGITHVVMELCDVDLDRFLQWNAPSGKLISSDLRTLIDNMARGYYALFQQHIVHRDIKPQNILITINSANLSIASAKITDFGVSRMLAEENQLSNVAGTLYYMAPEVGANLISTCIYDHSVDMWSIGCVIYQSLMGKIPFDECALCRLFLNCAGKNYDAYDIPQMPENTAADIRTLIASLLEIDREKRATPEQLYQAITSQSQ